jgi:cell division septation protein DedD
MNRTTTFQIPVPVDQLRPPIFAGAVQAPLAEPLQALLAAASRRAAESPFTMFLCADDDSTRVRDDFAMALARTLTATIPSTLVVDCDFLHPGLNGQVPQRDALGFLDYLLYGSSIGVITQDDNGVHIVGPGSFPVTRRMPFVEGAFSDAARRLVAHARCVIFVGPVFDGDGGRHPITTAVDVVTTVRTTARHPRLDSAEEHIAAAGTEVWSVRLSDAVMAAAPSPAPPAPPAPPPSRKPQPRPPKMEVPPPPPPPRAPAAGAPPSFPDELMAEPEREVSSTGPRIAVALVGVIVVALVVWWYLQNRGASDLSGAQDTDEAVVTAPDTTVRAPAARDTVARDPAPTTGTAGALAESTRTATPAVTETTPPVSSPEEPELEPEIEPEVAPAPTRTTGAGGTQLINSEDIQLMEDLNRRYNGWFMIHISSFQTSGRAREEVAFLQSREFPAFIVFLDLGAKGKWYRVYAGPFQTREEARDVKKNLDAIPQVRFTRIASIPD